MRIGFGIKASLAALGLLVLSACKFGDDKVPYPPSPPPPAPPATYTVGGTVSGLTGSITLANNGGDSRTITANGAFTFATAATTGTAYNVAVISQPANQTCTVTSGAGTIAASNVTNVSVSCTTNTFTVGGTVTGLVGGGLVLRNNGGNDLTRDANGAFAFTTGVATGGAYAVTIATQPANQTCTLANTSGTIAAANITNVTVTCETFRVTAVIGATGGTLVGPDGVEVVIPAGALSQPTTIGIARSAGGWPMPLIDGATRFGSIYELTPHDVIFDKPVLIRLPAPVGAANPYALVSSFDQGWQRNDVSLNGSYAELERNVFSWMYIVSACAPSNNDPYPCSMPRGHSFATATPANAISMISGAGPVQTNGFYVQQSAGTWSVNSNLLSTLHITTVFDAAPDCLRNPRVQLKRLVPGGNPPAQLIRDVPATLDADGNGRVTISIPAADLSQGNNTFTMRFSCGRTYYESEYSGADWISFQVAPNPAPGLTLNGTISGLTRHGLELQNGSREILAVPAGSTAFAFGTPLGFGANYDVRVLTQPAGQTCTVANGVGQITAPVTNIAVSCQSTAGAPGVVLVSHYGTNDVSVLSRDAGNGSLTHIGMTTSWRSPRSIVITPNGRFAYSGNLDSDSLSAFEINGTDVASLPDPRLDPIDAYDLAVDPNSRYLRVADHHGNKVTSYSIDSLTGELIALDSHPVDMYPNAIVTHPNGRFVYAVGWGQDVAAFAVNPSTGRLTSIPGAPHPTINPSDVAITPNGEFAYVLSSDGRIGRLTINPVTGALSNGVEAALLNSPHTSSMAIHPNGAFLYVGSGSSILVFSISSTGALTAAAQVPTGAGYSFMATDSAGDFLYVTQDEDNAIATYRIDAVSGGLTLVDTDALGGLWSQGIAVKP